MTRTAVYKHFDAEGVLLYVGITSNPSRRTREHGASADWFDDIASTTVEWHPSRKAALAVEAVSINAERPKQNIANATQDGPKFSQIGHRLRGLRVEAGLTQAQFAKSLGFKTTQLCNWEVGSRQPSIDAAIVICEAADVSLDWIFRGTKSGGTQ